MSTFAKRRVAVSVVITIAILVAAVAAIFWARGFKPDLVKGRIERTGLIVAASIPTGAQVYLDGRLTSATDTNIAFLEPKTYKVRIEKDGYTTWEKDVEVKADLASEIKALLFPLAPEIKPLTTTGAANPVLSPDGTRIVYGVSGERGGLYLLPMSDRPFPFRQDAKRLVKNLPGFDFATGQFLFSPDSKQVIVRFMGSEGQTTANLLIDTEKTDQEPRDITAALTATLTTWQQDLDSKAQTLAATVPESIKAATAEARLPSPQSPASNLTTRKPEGLNYYPTGLVFSPDEEKILYKDKAGKYKVYDLKKKKELTLPDFPNLLNISWYPDSAHLILAEKDLIAIIEADGTNKITVYSGKFENGTVFAHPSGTRLIIPTTLTQTEGNPPNLYSVNLR